MPLDIASFALEIYILKQIAPHVSVQGSSCPLDFSKKHAGLFALESTQLYYTPYQKIIQAYMGQMWITLVSCLLLLWYTTGNK
jgi:hypothetical protein